MSQYNKTNEFFPTYPIVSSNHCFIKECTQKISQQNKFMENFPIE